ncbi:MAG: hypothetical protein KF745_13645 [Phycisphaeraceae bacterium]|nr:hypothetical protein [Phycisphaeraceae bacterium]
MTADERQNATSHNRNDRPTTRNQSLFDFFADSFGDGIRHSGIIFGAIAFFATRFVWSSIGIGGAIVVGIIVWIPFWALGRMSDNATDKASDWWWLRRKKQTGGR